MKRTYTRHSNEVRLNGEYYASAKTPVAAATIVDALIRAEGRIPKEPSNGN